MTERLYGILPGTGLNGTPPPPPVYRHSQRATRSRSPLKQTVSPFSDAEQARTPPTRFQSQAQATHYDRKELARPAHPSRQNNHQAPPPPPPQHRSIVSQRQTVGSRPYEATASAITGSDVSLESPQDSRSRAFQAVDNLYSPRITTPSPERDTYFNSPYHDESPRRRQDLSERGLSRTSVPAIVPAYTAPSERPPVRGSMFTDRTSSPSQLRASYYHGDGYDDIDPESIVDDHDDVFRDPPPRTRSRLSLSRPMIAATAGATTGVFGSEFLNANKSRDTSGQYQALSAPQPSLPDNRYSEKSEWLTEQDVRRRRRKRLLIILGAILLIGIIVGAVVGGVLASRKNATSSSSSNTNAGLSSSTTSSGTRTGGLFDIDSKEVQAVLGQKDLHKVFPGMDYTPLNAQYPDCLHNPPEQNNITLDVAVLSQLTPAIRLYGTDCGQTEMVLSAIDRLKMNDTMQVWLGVWLGSNVTTNNRQIAQMYDILDKYPTSHFAGIILGNEVLFRQELTLNQLGQTLTQVRTNLTTKKISLPVATSDLGDNWNAGLAATSDIVMANIHPFFAGVTPDVAPGWTYNFWQTRNSKLVPATTGSWPKSIVSEVGWPSDGGNNCGTSTTACASGKGAVASVDNMNTFMEGFVCPSLTNGTTFFWFSAFDEPWKAIFNTANDQWESKWGLMDVDRNLKSGLNIPDCGGKTVTKAY